MQVFSVTDFAIGPSLFAVALVALLGSSNHVVVPSVALLESSSLFVIALVGLRVSSSLFASVSRVFSVWRLMACGSLKWKISPTRFALACILSRMLGGELWIVF